MGAILNSPSYVWEMCDESILIQRFEKVPSKLFISKQQLVQVPYDLNCKAKGIFFFMQKKTVKGNE